MRLSAEAVQEFKAICLDEFGVRLSDAEAEQRAVEVLEFFWFLFDEEEGSPGESRASTFDRPGTEDLR